MAEATAQAHSPNAIFLASRMEDLDSLRRLGGAPRKKRIQLALPGLREELRADFERRLAIYSQTCGCNEGSIAGLLYLIVVSLLLLTGWLAPRSFLAWAYLLVGFIACLVAGKILGLLWARWRFVRILKEVQRLALGQIKEI